MKKKIIFGLAALMAIGGVSFADDDSTCETVITTVTTAIGISAGGALGGGYGAGVGAVAGIAYGKHLSDEFCNNEDNSDIYIIDNSDDYSGWD